MTTAGHNSTPAKLPAKTGVYGDAGQGFTEQQFSDKRGRNQQSQSGGGFGDSGESQRVLHRSAIRCEASPID